MSNKIFIFLFFIISTSIYSDNYKKLEKIKKVTETQVKNYEKDQGKLEFNKYGVTNLLLDEGWVAINKSYQVLYIPFIYDNGPDYVEEGMIRFVEKGKMGFANEKGQKVIPAIYDFVWPFSGGIAEFCNGCKWEKHGEHTALVKNTGKKGKIDKKGKIIK